jgi:hypothetical protein
MGHVRVPQAVQVQYRVQPGHLPRLLERLVDSPFRQPPATLGYPQRGMRAGRKQRPHLIDPLVDDRHHPVHFRHQQHRPALRRTALRRLAPPHEQRSAAAEPAHLRVVPQVGQVQTPRLPAAQPERVDRLQQHRVPLRRQCALPLTGADLLHQPIGSIEQRLHLLISQRPPSRLSLVVSDVRESVPLAQHLLRRRSEPVQALRRPPVPRVRHVLQEQAQLTQIGPGCRGDDWPRPRAQMVDESLHLRRPPLPRILVTEHRQPSHQVDPALDGVGLQEPDPLLANPTIQHRLEHRRRRVEVDDAVGEHFPGRPR